VTHAAAFGFRVEGLAAGELLAVRGAAHWPVLSAAEIRAHVPDDDGPGGERLLHPGLALAALERAEARGVDSVHAGAVVGPEGAWAIVGAKEAGKSTLVGHLAALGAEVLTDDVLVIEDGRCLAGPRFVDLRPEAAARMHGTIAARGGTRGRLPLPPAPADAELAGFVYLAWADEIALERLSGPDHMRRLIARRAEDGWPRDPALMLDLAERPAYELRRPRRWEALDATVEALQLLVSVPSTSSA
jgi:hypothetical protein